MRQAAADPDCPGCSDRMRPLPPPCPSTKHTPVAKTSSTDLRVACLQQPATPARALPQGYSKVTFPQHPLLPPPGDSHISPKHLLTFVELLTDPCFLTCR